MTVKGLDQIRCLNQIRKMERIYHVCLRKWSRNKGGEIVQEGQFYDSAKSSFIPEARKLGQKPEEKDGRRIEGFELPPVVEFEALLFLILKNLSRRQCSRL